MKKIFTLDNLLKSGYIRTPRLIYELRYSSDPEARVLADLYEYLYSQCYFIKGTVDKLNKTLDCERGQIICSHAGMAKCTQIKPRKIASLLEELKQLEVIEVEQIEGISHIGIRYYDSLAGSLRETSARPSTGEETEKETEIQETREAANPQRVSYKGHMLSKITQQVNN